MMRKLLILLLLTTPALGLAASQAQTPEAKQRYQKTLSEYKKIMDDAIKERQKAVAAQQAQQVKKDQSHSHTHTTHALTPAPTAAPKPPKHITHTQTPHASHAPAKTAPPATMHAVPTHQQTEPSSTDQQPASAGFHISYD